MCYRPKMSAVGAPRGVVANDVDAFALFMYGGNPFQLFQPVMAKQNGIARFIGRPPDGDN